MKAIVVVIALVAFLVVGLVVAGKKAPPTTAPVPAAAHGIVSEDPASVIPGPGGFKPLQSDAVKGAIHRALRTGETQRWADANLSGYAVPSKASLANGCRAIRYTIDQQPEVPYRSITACE